MNNKMALESLSMDLMRVALGYHRNSTKMAERFLEEAFKRKNEIDESTLKPYIVDYLNMMDQKLDQSDKQAVAETSLLMSIIFQNYCKTYFK